MSEHSAPSDPLRTLRRLWRHELPAAPVRRGPKARVDVDRVVAQAVERADVSGLAGLSVRTLATDLGLSRMALYNYVDDRSELIDLMTEHVSGELLAALDDQPPSADPELSWRSGLARFAEAELASCRRHRWLLDVSPARPGLGPNSIGAYERELEALDGLGLTDLEMDQVRWLLINFVRGIARDEADLEALRTETGATDVQWWQSRARFLARFATPDRFPLATRVGTAAGEAQQAAYATSVAHRFGLERLLDGVAMLIIEPPG